MAAPALAFSREPLTWLGLSAAKEQVGYEDAAEAGKASAAQQKHRSPSQPAEEPLHLRTFRSFELTWEFPGS
eukprot:Skav218344  [mRNA]  locus=scaffold755:985497:985712:- [translate_table: standard]